MEGMGGLALSIVRKEFDKILREIKETVWFSSLEDLKGMLEERPLILYGCGQICKAIIFICEQKGIGIASLCDSNKTGRYEDTGYNIISPESVKEVYPDAVVMITSKRFENEINKQIRCLGFDDSQIYPFPLPHTYVLHPESFKANHLEGFEQAYGFFKDNVSREIIIDRMRMHLLGTMLKRTSTTPTYFEPGIISLSQNEVFVDAGCYKGETVEEFIKQIEGSSVDGYSHVYSFEPDPETCETAIENLKEYKCVDVIEKGLWSSETVLKFSAGGSAGSSFVFGISSVSVPVTSLDKFFDGKPDKELPTFIKMDIEGAEKEALIGAKNTIKKKHPKLAICVYHKPEDIYELPKQIYDIDPEYQFSLQQYSDGVYDTILYAI